MHVSIAGKIYNSIDRAAYLGCNAMQIFSRNPRQWRKGSLTQEDIKIFKAKQIKAKIKPVVIHAPYLLNLASQKKSFYKITIREFARDLEEAGCLGADYLVIHVGSYKYGTENAGLLSVVEALNLIFQEVKEAKTKILLENTTGSGSWLGYKFSHFNFIFNRVNDSHRLGICLDTAHAWAAGYRVNEKKGLWVLLDEIQEQVGLDKLKLIHLNDTQVELGSRLDRHFHIGEGQIGQTGFKLILNQAQLKKLPFILETPKETKEADRKNLEVVRRLFVDEVHKRN